MRVRPVLVVLAALTLSACGGPTGSTPAGGTTNPVATGAGATATAAPIDSPSAEIDLSGLDACTLVDDATLTALTGETGFITDQRDNTDCFWAVPRPGVPQYLEVQIFRRAEGLAGYSRTVNNIACPGTTVPGIGAEAVGGVCQTPANQVWLAAMDRGVVVQVVVNEPKGALTPADLADAVNAVIAGLE
jgi:hypothetical protein